MRVAATEDRGERLLAAYQLLLLRAGAAVEWFARREAFVAGRETLQRLLGVCRERWLGVVGQDQGQGRQAQSNARGRGKEPPAGNQKFFHGNPHLYTLSAPDPFIPRALRPSEMKKQTTNYTTKDIIEVICIYSYDSWFRFSVRHSSICTALASLMI